MKSFLQETFTKSKAPEKRSSALGEKRLVDVLLVHANCGLNEYPPLGLGYLAAVALEEGFSVKILDPTAIGDFSLEKFRQITRLENPKFVGFCLYTSFVAESFAMAKEARLIVPGAIVFAGGPHASATLNLTLEQCPFLDALIYGEGEETFRELLKNKPLEEIRGICFRKNGKTAKNPPRPLIQNPDSLPFPARKLFSKNYVYDVCVQNKPVANIMASRGCPYNCIFCSKETFGASYRKRSVQNVVEEVSEAVNVLGFKELYFFDDVFMLDRKWVFEFCNRLKQENVDVPWKCLGRVDCVDSGALRAMKGAGCHTVYFGIESGNEEVLRSTKKGITKKQARRGIAIARKAGLDASGYFILGLPGENENTINETIAFASELELDWAFFYTATAFPGNRLYDFIPEKYKKKWSMLQRYYPRPPETAEARKGGDAPISLCDLSGTELLKLKEKAYQKFYFNPDYLKKNVFSKPNSPTFYQKLLNVRNGAPCIPAGG